VNTPDWWRVVRPALESWSRTTRLCLILLILGLLMCAEIWITFQVMRPRLG
jgi:hypothetical protein